MSVNVTKITMYVVLLVLVLIFGTRFLGKYNRLMSTEVGSDRYELVERPEEVVESTEPLDTNEVVNAEADTNAVSTSEESTLPVEVEDELVPPTKQSFDRDGAPDVSGIGLDVVVLMGVIAALGLLIAHDVSSYLGQRTHKLLHNEEGEGIVSVEYDAAEDTWAKGEYLEAIRMMREYLGKNPREVHVMLRIAEIYEKDLGNFLAAALEYEELLQKKLPRERWGWAAIHLVNLYYGKLGRSDDGLALLYRIHREYGDTAAAEKARKRLLQLDPEFQAELDHWEAGQSVADTEGGESGSRFEDVAAEEPSEPMDPNLPKGFRKRR